jgi:hypothetical protein
MTSDLVIFSACSMGMASTPVAGTVHRILALTSLITLLGVVEQFLFYMRTDVYLVVQELAGCKNLFGDATEYLRYLAGRLARRPATDRPNPLADLPPAEQRPVRLYAAVVLAGCAATVPVIAFYGAPVEIGVYVRAVHEFARGLSSSRIILVADAAGVLTVSLLLQALLARTILRTYRPQLNIPRLQVVKRRG